jgi:hypothetical protein
MAAIAVAEPPVIPAGLSLTVPDAESVEELEWTLLVWM